MIKKVILSTDNNIEYLSLLPLAAYSWNKLGYKPVVLTVNVSEANLRALQQYCVGCELIVVEPVEGVKDSTVAQLSRLFQGYDSDDILISSDADMVIARDIFLPNLSTDQIVSYGFDLTGKSELPICYIQSTARKWKELIGAYTVPQSAYSSDWNLFWSTDQQLLTQRAREYGMGKITFVDRGNQNKHGLPTGRWDRFDFSNIPDTIIDVHMPRNDWNAQYQVAERLWPGEDHSFITKFREALGKLSADKINLAYGEELKPSINIEDIHGVEMARIDIPDEFGFLRNIDNWSNHRPLLLLALHLAHGDVYEFGCGDGSTPYLREFCEATGRRFRSFESNEVWALRCESEFVKNWDDDMLYWPCSVAFVDHAPGEHRHIAVKRLAEFADIIVIHDTEEGGAGNYQFHKIWHLFKYRLNYNKTGGGAGATAVSNKIDLNRFRGLSLGQFTFDKD